MHPLITSLLGNAAITGAATYDLRRSSQRPAQRPVSGSLNELTQAYADLSEAQTGRKANPIKLVKNEVTPLNELGDKLQKEMTGNPEIDKALLTRELSTAPNASMQPLFELDKDGKVDARTSKRVAEQVNINPNVSEELYAHELGHAMSGQTKFGDALQRIRLSPKLGRALSLGGGLTALGAAAMTPGDDDLAAAIAGNTLVMSPILLDELLASKNALAIMDKAGRKASLGQRGRLAGAFMSYLAAPAGMAVLANTLGNQFDEDV